MSKEFCEEAIDCLVSFSNCYPNSCVWKKSSTTISIEWTKVRYFTFEKGLKALGMLICPIKIDWIRYDIRKYIFIGYNSRIKVTISTIKE